MDHSRTIITKSAQETQILGEELGIRIKEGKAPRIVCLYGELGSGKTTFVQGLAKGLGVVSTRLLSPTFIIVRRYALKQDAKFFHHMDLYRVTTKEELEGLGLTELFMDSVNYVAIEWPERLGESLKQAHIEITCSVLSDGTHQIVYG